MAVFKYNYKMHIDYFGMIKMFILFIKLFLAATDSVQSTT